MVVINLEWKRQQEHQSMLPLLVIANNSWLSIAQESEYLKILSLNTQVENGMVVILSTELARYVPVVAEQAQSRVP